MRNRKGERYARSAVEDAKSRLGSGFAGCSTNRACAAMPRSYETETPFLIEGGRYATVRKNVAGETESGSAGEQRPTRQILEFALATSPSHFP